MILVLTGFLKVKYTRLHFSVPDDCLNSDLLLSYLDLKFSGFSTDIKAMMCKGVYILAKIEREGKAPLYCTLEHATFKPHDKIILYPLYTAHGFFSSVWKGIKKVAKVLVSPVRLIQKLFSKQKAGVDTSTQPDNKKEEGGNYYGKDGKANYGDLEVFPMVFGEFLVEGKIVQEGTISVNEFNLKGDAQSEQERQESTIGTGTDSGSSSGVTYDEITNTMRGVEDVMQVAQELENQEQLLKEINESYSPNSDISITFIRGSKRYSPAHEGRDEAWTSKYNHIYMANGRSSYYQVSKDKFYNTDIFTKEGIVGTYEWIRPFKTLLSDFYSKYSNINLLSAKGREILRLYCRLAKLQCYYDFYDCQWAYHGLQRGPKNNWEWIRSNEVGWSREEILKNFNTAKAEFGKLIQEYRG